MKKFVVLAIVIIITMTQNCFAIDDGGCSGSGTGTSSGFVDGKLFVFFMLYAVVFIVANFLELYYRDIKGMEKTQKKT